MQHDTYGHENHNEESKIDKHRSETLLNMICIVTHFIVTMIIHIVV